MEARRPARIEVLQVLRLFAASMIILYHSDRVGSCGFFGVQIFFVISGFLSVYSTAAPVSPRRYICRRMIRLLPLYWITTILTFWLLTVVPDLSRMSDSEPLHFLKSLFFIPYYGKTGAILPIVAVGWTMQYEMVFTLLFSLSLLISHRHRALVCSLFLLSLTAVGLFLKPRPLCLSYYTDSHYFPFFLGLLAGSACLKLRASVPDGKPLSACLTGAPRILFSLVLSLLALASVLFLILSVYIPFPSYIPLPFRMGIPAFVLVFSLVLLADRVAFPSKFLTLCNMTYSIFLVEYFTTSVYKRLVPDTMDVPMTVLSLAVLFAVTFALSAIPYRLVEVWLTSRLQQRLLTPRTAGKEGAAS